jgi:hypothetical protein
MAPHYGGLVRARLERSSNEDDLGLRPYCTAAGEA